MDGGGPRAGERLAPAESLVPMLTHPGSQSGELGLVRQTVGRAVVASPARRATASWQQLVVSGRPPWPGYSAACSKVFAQENCKISRRQRETLTSREPALNKSTRLTRRKETGMVLRESTGGGNSGLGGPIAFSL